MKKVTHLLTACGLILHSHWCKSVVTLLKSMEQNGVNWHKADVSERRIRSILSTMEKHTRCSLWSRRIINRLHSSSGGTVHSLATDCLLEEVLHLLLDSSSLCLVPYSLLRSYIRVCPNTIQGCVMSCWSSCLK